MPVYSNFSSSSFFRLFASDHSGSFCQEYNSQQAENAVDAVLREQFSRVHERGREYGRTTYPKWKQCPATLKKGNQKCRKEQKHCSVGDYSVNISRMGVVTHGHRSHRADECRAKPSKDKQSHCQVHPAELEKSNDSPQWAFWKVFFHVNKTNPSGPLAPPQVVTESPSAPL